MEQELINQIIEENNKGLTYKEIMVKYNIPRGTLDYHLRKKNKLKSHGCRALKVDHTYFNIIDSEEKAYLLGFFMADGCINKDGRSSLCITEADIEIINYFNNAIGYGQLKPATIHHTKGALDRKPQVVLRWTSRIQNKALEKYGVVPNKTKTEFSMELVPAEFKPHLIRGYFDGDGSFRGPKSDKGRKGCEMVFCNGTRTILEEIKTFFNAGTIKERTGKTQNYYHLTICNKATCQRFYECLYTNAHFFLERKRKKLIMNFGDLNNTVLNVEPNNSTSV